MVPRQLAARGPNTFPPQGNYYGDLWVLAQFTDQLTRAVKNSPQRAVQAAEMAKGFGCEMKKRSVDCR